MQDLFQNYVNDLSKMRDEFHEELRASATELSKAMGDYSRRGEEALTSFMAKVPGATHSRLQRRRGSINFEASQQTALFRKKQLPPWQSGLWRTALRTMGTASSGPRSRWSNPDRPLEDPQGAPVTALRAPKADGANTDACRGTLCAPDWDPRCRFIAIVGMIPHTRFVVTVSWTREQSACPSCQGESAALGKSDFFFLGGPAGSQPAPPLTTISPSSASL